MVDESLRADKNTKTKKKERGVESRKVLGELKQRLRGFAYALRESFQAQDSLRRDFVTQDQFIAALRNMAITLTRRKRDALFHHFDPNDSNCIKYEPIVHILCGSSKRKKTSPKKGVTSPRRHRIHRSKAELLGFTGDEKLHQEYVCVCVFSTCSDSTLIYVSNNNTGTRSAVSNIVVGLMILRTMTVMVILTRGVMHEITRLRSKLLWVLRTIERTTSDMLRTLRVLMTRFKPRMVI